MCPPVEEKRNNKVYDVVNENNPMYKVAES